MFDLLLSKFNPSDFGILCGAIFLVVIISAFNERRTKKWMEFILELRGCDEAIQENKKDIPNKKAD